MALFLVGLIASVVSCLVSHAIGRSYMMSVFRKSPRSPKLDSDELTR